MKRFVRLLIYGVIVSSMFCWVATGNAAQKKIVIGACLHDQQHGFQIDIGKGMKEVAAKYSNVELLFTDSELDLAKELSHIETFINRKADVIILGATDSEASVAAVKAANRAGIPVIVVDCPTNGGDITCFIGYSSYEQGYIAGQLMAKYLKGKGKVAEVDFPFKSIVIDNRNRGFRDAIKGTDIEIVAVQSGEAKREKSMEAAEYMITAHPDLAGIFGVHGDAGLGALAAVRAAGKEDRIIVTTIDADVDVLEAMKRGGAIKGIATTFPVEIGRWAIEVAVKCAEGNMIPSYMEIPVLPIEQKDVGKFMNNN